MPSTDDLSSLIDSFRNARRCQEIEEMADRLSELADIRSANALIYRLADSKVQEDPDVEDAVCSALVRLGIMEKLGNLTFRLRSSDEIPVEAKDLVSDRMLVPLKYLRP